MAHQAIPVTAARPGSLAGVADASCGAGTSSNIIQLRCAASLVAVHVLACNCFEQIRSLPMLPPPAPIQHLAASSLPVCMLLNKVCQSHLMPACACVRNTSQLGELQGACNESKECCCWRRRRCSAIISPHSPAACCRRRCRRRCRCRCPFPIEVCRPLRAPGSCAETVDQGWP